MSLTEVKEEIERMSPQEREEIAAWLKALELSQSAEYRERVTRAHREIDAGRFVTLAQLKEIVAKNQAAHQAS